MRQQGRLESPPEREGPQQAEAVYGLRVEIPRVQQRAVPLAALLDGRGGRGAGAKGTLATNVPPGLLLPVSADAPPAGIGGGGGVVSGGGGGVVSGGGGVVSGGGGVGGGVASWPTVRTHVVPLHLTQDTVGGAADSELRSYGPIAGPFRIRQLLISPRAAGTVGQFVDVLVASGRDDTDSATPLGTSILRAAVGPGGVVAPDSRNGLAVPGTDVVLEDVWVEAQSGMFVQVRSYFVAPAVAAVDVSVVLVIEEVAAPVAPYVPPSAVPPPTTTPTGGGTTTTTTTPTATPTPPPPTTVGGRVYFGWPYPRILWGSSVWYYLPVRPAGAADIEVSYDAGRGNLLVRSAPAGVTVPATEAELYGWGITQWSLGHLIKWQGL